MTWNGLNVICNMNVNMNVNCNSRAEHYSGVKRFDETGVEANELKQGQDYGH